MNLSSPATSRRVAIAAFIALLALASLVGAISASASTSASSTAKGCAKQVINDWYSHRSEKVPIRGHYPLHCYQDALDGLGGDLDTYTNARQAISAAAAAEALRCKDNCGPPGGSPLLPGEKAIAHRNTYDFGGILVPQTDPVPVSSSSPSSVPLPLIILAGLAVLLLLAGGGSYIARRLKANRPAPPAADTPS